MTAAAKDEDAIARASEFFMRRLPEGPATINQVREAVVGAPVLDIVKAPDPAETLDEFRNELVQVGAIWHRWHEEGEHVFDFDFDSFRFLNARADSFGRMKHHIKADILRRFGSVKIESVVYILRGRPNERTNYRMGAFFDELKPILKYDQLIGYPLDPKRRVKDPVFPLDFSSVCSGKSILLVEPLLIDDGLDYVYERISEIGGKVKGVLVMFEVKGVSTKSLLHHDELLTQCGQKRLSGQVRLDLSERH